MSTVVVEGGREGGRRQEGGGRLGWGVDDGAVVVGPFA
jgi:hypothetical protein